MPTLTNPWMLLGALVLAIAIYGGGWWTGYKIESTFYDERVIADQKQALAQANAAASDQKARDAISYATDLQAKLADQRRQDALNLIPQRIPVYVTKKSDAACVLPFGFTKLLDAYALGTDPDALPGAASEPNDAPSGIPLSSASALLAAALSQRAAAYDRDQQWLEWANRQQALNPKQKPSWLERNMP